jgi:hypothetical protein
MSSSKNNKPFWQFLIGFLLLSAIPGVIYFGFSHNLGGYSTGDLPGPKAHTASQSVYTTTTAPWTATLTPTKTPLTMGSQVFLLNLKNQQAQAVVLKTPPSIQFGMDMDGHPMTAHTTIVPTKHVNQWTVTTDFTMGGQWTVDIRPNTNGQDKLTLPLWILEK